MILGNKTVLALVAATTIATSSAYAHGKKEHKEEAQDYDATSEIFGEYVPGMEPNHTIEISMADTMRFSPESIEIKQGDVVRFVVTNGGALQHEFVLGTNESLEEHAALMIKFPNMEHEEPYMAHVDPGKNMEIVWKFSQAGDFEFGCLLPGHFDAGMKGTITVATASAALAANDSPMSDLPVVSGEVKKVKRGKITIRHEAIPNLEMPGMTMVFRVDDDALISEMEKGDLVNFTVEERDGKMYIVTIDAANK